METATVNGVTLEYQVNGSGEPALLIPMGPIAESFSPFSSRKELAQRFQLIRYHQRGQAGSTRTPPPVSFDELAADAAALLSHLGIDAAHIIGHSTGAVTALQLALNHPARVHSLTLLEPPVPNVPSAALFFEKAAPFIAAYNDDRVTEAVEAFFSLAFSLDWEECRRLIDEGTPGGSAQVLRDAANFFGALLPALANWRIGFEQAARISQPVLCVSGTETDPWFTESTESLQAWLPRGEACRVPGVAHLLHLQRSQPLIERAAAFLARHPLEARLAQPR